MAQNSFVFKFQSGTKIVYVIVPTTTDSPTKSTILSEYSHRIIDLNSRALS